MTTAGRPTYNARVAQVYSGIRTGMVAARNQNAHTKLKFREKGQASIEELKSRDFKNELENKESILLKLKDKPNDAIVAPKAEKPLLLMNSSHALYRNPFGRHR